MSMKSHKDFLRFAEKDEFYANLHKLRVRFDGSYSATCSCGWVGPKRPSRREATDDGVGHAEVGR